MKQQNYTGYFRVYQNDTAITKVSTNDFRQTKLTHGAHYALPAGEGFYYGYKTLAKAMQMAKTGALAHINLLLGMGKAGEAELLQYRMDHYDDLNNNLIDANIDKARVTADYAL